MSKNCFRGEDTEGKKDEILPSVCGLIGLEKT